MVEWELDPGVEFFMMRRSRWVLCAIVLAVVIAAELGVRAGGAVSFPLYRADSAVGYWPSPNQAGSFLNRNRWFFNERSMGVPEAFQPDNRPDILLIGDSIVLGGNSFDHDEKLGPRLTKLTGRRHWPLSAGSWALLNELHHLKRNMDIVEGSDALVFVLNSADFGQASSWSCESTHPLKRPQFALAYIVQKYVLAGHGCSDTPDGLKVPLGDWRAAWTELMTDFRVKGKPVEVWLYPTREEALRPELLEARLESVGAQLKVNGVFSSLVIRSFARDSRWPRVAYVDAIHPDAQGVAILSAIMAAPAPATLRP